MVELKVVGDVFKRLVKLGGVVLPGVVEGVVLDFFCFPLKFPPLLLALAPALAIPTIMSTALTCLVFILLVSPPAIIFGLFSSMID